MRWLGIGGTLLFIACVGGGNGGGGAAGTGTSEGGTTVGDTEAEVPASAPVCEAMDGYMSVKIEGDLAGAPVSLDWPSALGPITRLSPPSQVTTIYSVGPYPRYDSPNDVLRLKWLGASDFAGALPLQARVSSDDGPLDIGNCEYESRIWRIGQGSYVFELTGLSSLAPDASSTDHCDGAAQGGTLLGCMLDSH